ATGFNTVQNLMDCAVAELEGHPVNAVNTTNQYFQGGAGSFPSSMTGPPWGTGSAAIYNFADALQNNMGNDNQKTRFLQGGPMHLQGAAAAAQPATALVTPEALQGVVAAALAHWHLLGVAEQAIIAAAQVPIYLTDLPGTALGYGTPVGIVIDVAAAGH